jgi:tetratricopeptide (TPR) repeat protein
VPLRLLVSLLVSLQLGQAGRVLLKVEPGQVQPVAVETAARRLDVTLQPAVVETGETLVLYLDLLAPEDEAPVATGIRRWLEAGGRNAARRILVYGAGEWLEADTSLSAAVLEKDLRARMRSNLEAGAAPAEPAALFDQLLAVLPEAGEAWRTVIWAGRFPALPTEFRAEAQAVLRHALEQRRLRLILWHPGETAPEDLAAVADAASADRLIPRGFTPKDEWLEIEWAEPAWAAGFRPEPGKLLGDDGEALAPAMVVARHNEHSMPTLAALAELRAAAAAQTETAGAAELRRLAQALQANGGDEPALDAGAALAGRLKNHAAAASLLEPLTRLRPSGAAVWLAYAHALYDRGPAIESLAAMRRARELNPQDPLPAERLGYLAAGSGDIPAALRHYTESLTLNPDNEPLWWTRATAAARAGEPKVEIEALEAALRRYPGLPTHRARLAGLYLDAGEVNPAMRHLDAGEKQLPDERPMLAGFADLWERAGEPGRALALWERAVAVEPSFAGGHLAITRIHSAAGRWNELLGTASRGVEVLPDLAGLHQARARALWAMNRWQERRRHLREAAARLDDPEVIRLAAEAEDTFGSGTALWRRFAEAQSASLPVAALQRGWVTAVRDGHARDSAWFYERFEKPPVPRLTPGSKSVAMAVIPGGMRALAYAAKSKLGAPEEFLLDYSRALAQHQDTVNQDLASAYRDALEDYFRKLAGLRAKGVTRDGRTVITLAVGTKKEKQQTRDILNFLGYRFRDSRRGISVEAGGKEQHGRRQGLLAALQVDEVVMVESLESGRTFTIEVADESVPVLLDPEMWLKQFGASPFGIAGLLARSPDAAKVYAGLASAGPRAAHFTASAVGLKQLAERYADRLFFFGSALTLTSVGGAERMSAPGGDAAEPIWRSLAGASINDPLSFIRNLVTRDDGRVLAWYHALLQMTPARQRFFTGSPDRARAFYKLFSDAPELRQGVDRRARATPVIDFLRQIPLDEEGSVVFPGDPTVWQVARGQSGLRQVDRLAKRMARARPADEDEILTRIARQTYSAGQVRHTMTANFMSLVRIDQSRAEPLTPEEALLLTQQYAEHSGVYPYFTILTGLNDQDFRAFFSFSAIVRNYSKQEAQLALGYFHSLTKLLCLLSQAGQLSPAEAARLFNLLCAALAATRSPGEMAQGAGAVLDELAGAAPGALERIEAALYGPADVFNGPQGRPISPGALRRRQFRQLLEAQKIPDLDAVRLVLNNAAAIRKAPPAEAGALAKSVAAQAASLPVLEFPKKAGISGAEKDAIEVYSPGGIANICRELQREAASRKPNTRDFEKGSGQLLDRLSPLLQLSLTGVIYAHYLRPSDLAAVEDPWLVRKHQFFAVRREVDIRELFEPSAFEGQSTGLGSFASGTLANFAQTAAKITVAGRPEGGRFGAFVFEAQIDALRSSLLARLSEADLRRLHLLCLLGREWVIHSAVNPGHAPALDAALAGLVSPSRKLALQRSLAAQTFDQIDDSLTLSDLFWLGQTAARLPEDSRWASPLWTALEAADAAARPDGLDPLGPVASVETGRDVPSLVPLPPYEDYEMQMFPNRMASRVAEFKLYAAVLVDRHGLPAPLLEVLTEPLLERIMAELDMADMRDWRSVHRRMREADLAMLESVTAEVKP